MENKEIVVRKIANRILLKFNLKPPIVFDEIINKKDIKYIEENLGTNGDGYSDLTIGSKKIVINSEIKYEPRKRFTIAHELGHHLISWHNDITLCQTDNEYQLHNMLDIQENEANIFASELLMPSEWVAEQLIKYNYLTMADIIKKLCEMANTSIMACLYCLENSLDSGHAIIINGPNIPYGKKFISKKTCENWLRKMNFEDICEFLSIKEYNFSIGSYDIRYFKFVPCPNEKDVLLEYNNFNNNLSKTLLKISNGQIIHMLHCLKSILLALSDKYIIKVYYQQELILLVKSNYVELVYKNEDSLNEFRSYCSFFSYEFDEITIGKEIILAWVKEPFYVDPEYWKYKKIDNKILLNDILNELYVEDTLTDKRRMIAGIIGSANGSKTHSSIQELYNIMQIRLRRNGLEEFVGHRCFNLFVSLKAYQLYRK